MAASAASLVLNMAYALPTDKKTTCSKIARKIPFSHQLDIANYLWKIFKE
jgi:hypothetical protein